MQASQSFRVIDTVNRTEKPRILIIGYGYGGSRLTALLARSGKCDITVLTPFEYMEKTTRMTAVIAGSVDHSENLYDVLRDSGVTYEIGQCTRLTQKSCWTSAGQEILFDVCVVATGRHQLPYSPDPRLDSKIERRKQNILDLRDVVKGANVIAIVGGGAIGCEQAADIKMKYTDKRVILIDAHNKLMPQMSEHNQRMTHSALSAIGVELVLGERVTLFEQGVVFFATGRKIASIELLISAYSQHAYSNFMPVDAVDEESGHKRLIRVMNTFQVTRYPKLFAFGDCCNYQKESGFGIVSEQITTVVLNVENFLADKPLRPHMKGLMSRINGPPILCFGYDHPQCYGIGPNLSGLPGFCCWFCPCFGGCCSAPAGYNSACVKNEFGKALAPMIGRGISI